MKYFSWRTLFSLVMVLSLAGAVIHGFFGNPITSATHVFIGTIAAALRGTCDQ